MPGFFDRLRSITPRWRTAIAVGCNAVLCEIGARIGLPGVDGSRVQHFFETTNRGLLALYNLLVGGAVSRAALLALGAVPYLQAQLYLWLARAAFPTVRRITADSSARRTAVRLTTIGLAVVQSFGFARFLQGIPGAVLDPGIGFIGRTVLLVTGGSIVVGWLGDIIVGAARADAEMSDIRDVRDPLSSQPRASTSASDGAPILAEGPSVPLLESGALPDLPLPTAAADRAPERVR